MNDNSIILAVDGVCAGYGAGDVISEISFSLGRGECLCIAGGSGCGKSTLLKAVSGMFGSPAVSRGSIVFDGVDMLAMGTRQRAAAAARGMGIIFQNPGSAFNPIRSYKKQFIETLKSHRKYNAAEFYPAVREVFLRLGLQDCDRILSSCPYELSGGMNQRTALALCMLMEHKLLLADEPTSALDSVSRRIVADELIMLRQSGLSQITVTHDIALAAYIADRIAVMHEGRIVELAPAKELIKAPLHPYTRFLLNSIPTLGSGIPELGEYPAGSKGELYEHSPGHFVRMEAKA